LSTGDILTYPQSVILEPAEIMQGFVPAKNRARFCRPTERKMNKTATLLSSGAACLGRAGLRIALAKAARPSYAGG
jgi:hypothetical protein